MTIRLAVGSLLVFLLVFPPVFSQPETAPLFDGDGFSIAVSGRITNDDGGMVFADPMVLAFQGDYYLYVAEKKGSYSVFRSDNLIDWHAHREVVYRDTRGDLWAPEVHYHPRTDKFYLYYTCAKGPSPSQKVIGVASADGPAGPFIDAVDLVEGAIDAHVFRDEGDRLYLYYAAYEWCLFIPSLAIFGCELETPTRLRKASAVRLLKSEARWEMSDYPFSGVTEAPWLIKHLGVHYLMYSGNGADLPSYAIGYATSGAPLGPFVKSPLNPVVRGGDGIFGPGHSCIVTGPTGERLMVHHQKQSAAKGYRRFLAIAPLWFDEAGNIRVRPARPGANQ